jgi:HK97 family phage major capsid protein
MKNIMELRRELAARVKEARGLLEQPDKAAEFDALMVEIEKRKDEIVKEERLQALEMETGKTIEDETPAEIREFGDFLQEVRWGNHSRLKTRDVAGGTKEKRALSMGVGAQGGFLVPEQFDANIRMVTDGSVLIRPRAQVIPAGDPPDSAITIPALDQSGARGVYSGVTVDWIAEGHQKPETEPRFSEIKLEPHEVAASVFITDKLLRNSKAAGALVQQLMRKVVIAAEEDAFYTGDGVGKPLGIIGHPSSINVARTAAAQIQYADIVGMYSQAKFGGKLAWIASQTTLPQLMTLADPGAAGTLIWQPNAREGAPGTLLGIPVLLNDQSPVLGALGDLALVDLDYYLIKDGSGIAIAMSEHVRFRENQVCIKVFWNVDGQPWLTTPLLQRDGASQVSPFVVLQ